MFRPYTKPRARLRAFSDASEATSRTFALPARQLLPQPESVGGVGNAGNRNAINGKQRNNTAADVNESAEVFKVRNSCGQNITRPQIGDIIQHTFLLCCLAGQHNSELSVLFP